MIESSATSNGISFIIINEKQYEPFRQTVIDFHNGQMEGKSRRELVQIMARAKGETYRRHFIPLIGVRDYIIFDRSIYTSGVHNHSEEISMEEIIQINLNEGVIKPDEGLVLLCGPKIAKSRIDERRKSGGYNLPSMQETLEQITARRELYLELIQTHPELYLLDTTNTTKEEVFSEVKEKLRI